MSYFSTITRGQFLLSPFAFAGGAAKPKIVFVCGDHEYSGESTLPLFGAELKARYGLSSLTIKSAPDQNGETDIPGLEALKDASLAVFFLRWRRLPLEQLAMIDAYVRSGKPVIALRTTSHAFNYPAGDEREAWNRWAPDVFGAPPGWNVEGHSHYGHLSTTRVRVNELAAQDPILKGVAADFTAPSWLYNVMPNYPPAKAKILLFGDAINPNKPAARNPVAWTWSNRYRGRAFYTSLGHPGDFALEPFQRLLTNAVFWALDARTSKSWAGRMKIDVPYRGMVKT